MKAFFETFETVFVTGTLAITFIISLFLLLLSIRKSGLSSFLLRALGYTLITIGQLAYFACGAFVIYVLSPINLLPLIPIDEFVAACGAIGSLGFGWMVKSQGLAYIKEANLNELPPK